MTLSKKVQELIENSAQLKRLIGAELGFEPRTIGKWSEINSPRLLSPAGISAISKHTGLNKSEILEKETIATDTDEVEPVMNK